MCSFVTLYFLLSTEMFIAHAVFVERGAQIGYHTPIRKKID